MKRTRLLSAVALLLASFVPTAESQVAGSPLYYSNVPLAMTWPAFTAGTSSSAPFSIAGLSYFQIVAVPSGTVTTCSVSVDGASALAGSFSTGSVIAAGTIGSCASALLYANTTPVTPALQGRITVSVSGTGSVTLFLSGYATNPSSSGGGFGCSGSLGNLTCASFATSNNNGGLIGTEGTCNATGFAPTVGLDLLCPSSASGPLSTHGWLYSNNGGAWQQLGGGSYPDLTDVSGVSLTSAVPIYHPVGSSGTPSISFTGHTATGFYWKSTNTICFTVGDTCDTYFSGGTVGVPSLNVFGVASSSTDASAIDTAWSRSGPGIWAAGTGAQGSETGMVRSANTQRLITSNYTNATTTPTTVLSWTTAQAFQNRNWAFYCHFVYQSSATTATLALSINDGIAPVYEMAHARIFTTLTGTSTDATVTGTASGNLPVLTGAAPNATGTNYEAEMYGSLEDNVAGGNPFSIQAAAGGTGTVTILRGSFCALQ